MPSGLQHVLYVCWENNFVGQNKETSSMNLVQQNFLSNLLQVMGAA